MAAQSWILYSLLSALFLAVVNIVDKYVITNLVKKPLTLVIFVAAMGLIPALVIFAFHGFRGLPGPNYVLAFLAGAASLLMSLFYFQAARIEEISRLVPLFYVTPIFVSVFAWLFLGEVFPPQKYAGVLLLVAGAILVSAKKSSGFLPGKSFRLLILAAIFYAAYLVLSKHLLKTADFWTVFAVIRTSMFVTMMPVFFAGISRHLGYFKQQNSKAIALVAFNELLALLGSLLAVVAASTGPITLVNALTSVQPFFVLVLALFLSAAWPHLLKEEVSSKIVALKFVAILLMAAGAALIT